MKFLRHLPRSAWKVACFAAVCLVLLGALAVRIGNLSLFSSQHTVTADLNDVTGLATGDQVDIAGVPVGQVTNIAEQHGHAVVTMGVNNTVSLRQDTDVGLRWKNVIGQKLVYLYPSSSGARLGSNATIPLSHDVSDASVDAFLNSLGPFLSAINAQQANTFVENVSGALEGDTAEIDQLINSGATVSQTVGALDTQVGQVIDNLDQVLTAIASRSGDVGSLISNLQTVSQSLASKNNVLDDVVVNLGQVAGDLASLVSNNRSTLDTSIGNLQSVSQDLVNHQQQLSQDLSQVGNGLAPYTEISSWGQWFNIQTIYTCLANQTACSYYEPGNAPQGSGPLGGPPVPGVPSLPSLPGSGSGTSGTSGTPNAPTTPLGGSGSSSAGSSSISSVLGAVGGLSSSGSSASGSSGGSGSSTGGGQ